MCAAEGVLSAVRHQKKCKQFIDLIQPELAIFTKYEFWYHYFQLLHARKVP
ncbi:hypothetical protein CS542_10515 [Pedobacter sp. IW39]|nr:hypothetical protein CS542_10515 [Pedobacter sp. IW39]